jgi:glycine cleavage system aminomethyltransferase T
MKRTNVFLKSTQIRELKSITRETGATVAGLIRKAIDDFIGRRKADQKREKAQRQHNPETR